MVSRAAASASLFLDDAGQRFRVGSRLAAQRGHMTQNTAATNTNFLPDSNGGAAVGGLEVAARSSPHRAEAGQRADKPTPRREPFERECNIRPPRKRR